MKAEDLSQGWRQLAYWGLPLIAFTVGFFVGHWPRTWLWTLSLSAMGVACIANARRCRRVHCYFTGPFFLVAAATALAFAEGWLPLGENGWQWIGTGVIVGFLVLRYLPELVWGRYFGQRI